MYSSDFMYSASQVLSSGQIQLCELLYKDRSNMTRLIGILEKKGLVIKQTCVDKRLVNKIQITKKGKKLKDLISPFIQQSRNKFFNGLTN